MTQPDPSQGSWFFHEEEPSPSETPQDPLQPGPSPTPSSDSWLLGDGAASEADPWGGPGPVGGETPSAAEPKPFAEPTAPASEPSPATGAITPEPAQPIAFESWMDGDHAPQAGTKPEAPSVIQGSWAESTTELPSIEPRKLSRFALAALAAALAFAGWQGFTGDEEQASLKPLSLERSIRHGVELEGPGVTRPGSKPSTEVRTLTSIDRNGRAQEPQPARSQAWARPEERPAPRSSQPAPNTAVTPVVTPTQRPSTSVLSALAAQKEQDDAQAEAAETLARLDAVLEAPLEQMEERQPVEATEPAVSLQPTAPAVAQIAPVGPLTVALPALELQRGFVLGEPYAGWFQLLDERGVHSPGLLVGAEGRVACVVEPVPREPEVTDPRPVPALAEAPASADTDPTNAEVPLPGTPQTPEGGASPSELALALGPVPAPVATPIQPPVRIVRPMPDPARWAALIAECTGEPDAFTRVAGWEELPGAEGLDPEPLRLALVEEQARAAQAFDEAAEATLATVPVTPEVAAVDVQVVEVASTAPGGAAAVWQQGTTLFEHFGPGTAPANPAAWSHTNGAPSAAEPTPTAPVVAAPKGTLRRVDSGSWEGQDPPLDLVQGSRRIATPRVGPVRLTLPSGEVFEGRLTAVGQKRIWIETWLGDMSFAADRVARIERVDPTQVDASGLESKEHEYSGKPHVRVKAAGGVFSGRLLSHEGDTITLWEDGGYRITLRGASLITPEEGAGVRARRRKE